MVMGMEGLLSISFSCSLAPVLINTYLFFSFSAAAAESRGPHLLWSKSITKHMMGLQKGVQQYCAL